MGVDLRSVCGFFTSLCLEFTLQRVPFFIPFTIELLLAHQPGEDTLKRELHTKRHLFLEKHTRVYRHRHRPRLSPRGIDKAHLFDAGPMAVLHLSAFCLLWQNGGD